MRCSLLLGVLLIAVAAFFTLTWSQSASVRLQQQIMEMRAKAFSHQKTPHAAEGHSEPQGEDGLQDGQREQVPVKDQGDRIRRAPRAQAAPLARQPTSRFRSPQAAC
jgi:hypothetical protein